MFYTITSAILHLLLLFPVEVSGVVSETSDGGVVRFTVEALGDGEVGRSVRLVVSWQSRLVGCYAEFLKIRI